MILSTSSFSIGCSHTKFNEYTWFPNLIDAMLIADKLYSKQYNTVAYSCTKNKMEDRRPNVFY